MTKQQSIHDQHLFEGLRALAESAFPKRCNTCGKVYDSAQEFIADTQAIRGRSGLKESVDDDGGCIVELFRNCSCGSTLLDFFSDRRDLTDRGLKRRERFGELMEYLVKRGVDRQVARTELLNVLNGQTSDILKGIEPPQKGQ